jgi:hypothetical protein
MKTIGDKRVFALTYRTHPDYSRFMGYAKIWLGGNFLGTDGDLIFIKSYVLFVLEQFVTAETADFDTTNTHALFTSLYTRLSDINDDEVRKYLVGGATFTDDFTAFAFYDSNDVLHIIWKLMENVAMFPDLAHASLEVHHFTISRKEYLHIFETIKNELEKDCAEIEQAE